METITANTSDQFFNIVNEFKAIFNADVESLQSIAQDEAQPFIKRKIIGLITSDDEALALKSIQWIHDLINGSNNLQLKIQESKESTNTGTFVLTKTQKAIYSKLKKDAESNLVGDDYLYKLLAINIDHFNQASLILSYTGFKMQFKTGAEQVRPEVTVQRDCQRNIQELIKELGLSTVSRFKVGITPKPKAKATLMSMLKTKAN